jgi:hypothetical protein
VLCTKHDTSRTKCGVDLAFLESIVAGLSRPALVPSCAVGTISPTREKGIVDRFNLGESSSPMSQCSPLRNRDRERERERE